ncbi:hypothetical protein AKJ09_06895 [Labilithrix luteola]|uniref:DUF2254 domain-containing protein n=1 Tax=Labilithrix luteola TaxID=1391654 RepID=A0A0K1Q3N0_9BACT|nr:DUF2254 family protein [Labilithrix luteola]AKV00232.1 hypothetical protein AKJ09_06895 [Labilithrix luteola]
MGTSRSVALILASLVLGYGIPHIRDRWLPSMGTDMGRDQLIAFLTSVATGMMTFTGVVLSLLFVMLELGATGYSPRIVSSWVKDPRIANATGVFTGTFVYSLMALRAIGLVQGSRSCALTIYIAFVWLLASLWMLTRLAKVFAEHDHTFVLRMLGKHGAEAIDWVYASGPSKGGDAGKDELPKEGHAPPQVLVHEGAPVYIVRIDVARLVALARSRGALIRIPFAQGDSVTAGATLAMVHGASIPPRRLRALIELGPERELRADPKYALRLLVDVALRALSTSTNDPTTAVQALDQIEALLMKLGNLDLDVGRVRDAGGELRLVYDATTWEEYLELALTEIQYYGAASLQTERRLAALFAFLRDHLPASRRAAVERLVQEHGAVVAQTLQGPSLILATRGDRQGLGHTLQ